VGSSVVSTFFIFFGTLGAMGAGVGGWVMVGVS